MRMHFRLSHLLYLTLLVAAQTMADDHAQLLGSWDLVSLENHGADGSVHQPLGATPVGRITYTADGRMMAQIMNPQRAPFASAELYGGTREEKAAAYDGYIAYYGTFSVDSATHAVTHSVKASLFPNWVGGQQLRFYALDNDTLALSTRPFAARGTMVTAKVLWRRAP